ncbi:putative N-acetyltransferase YjaB [Rubripirellula lacrimiformis]|uniref:Putative N-acetyltransferase YjaB n=1 Tax=Rubripirellula lacrimiformis TaxID=1930273 RepID=A0A517NBT0_9BACT|nr:GNAT family N-acetyltransferase [Rubripirellula lacrimiformis]QDT04594.1 putative N-acetyltransferase YjaB [Rubripirellula lacrimiformis]
MNPISIRIASKNDANDIAGLVDRLLREIMEAIGINAFNSNAVAMTEQLMRSIPDQDHFILIAETEDKAIGFAALSPAFSLYAGGYFGLVTELFVAPGHRSAGVGKQLIEHCLTLAASKNWSQLEVTTPPLPQFDRTLKFYQSNGFAITGGRKLKCPTAPRKL